MAELMTISRQGTGEYSEKKSKFIGRAVHVTSEEEAAALISEIKSKHWDARHNVYAYVIGGNGEIQRSTDDGEPSGTAGRPILEIIRGEGLTDVAVVVTRYFGGVLLGTGGLVRAYGKAAKAALENAERVRPVKMKTIAVTADYEFGGKIQNFLIKSDIAIDHINYQNDVTIFFSLPSAEARDIGEFLSRQFQRDVPFRILPEERIQYVPVEEGTSF